MYLRVVTESGTVTRIVASKTRVAHLSKQTIPMLDLLGAVILSRLAVYIKEILKKSLIIDRLCCWTDSLVTLYWLTEETREWKQFVQNRVDKVRRHVLPTQWRFCPGVDNPADLPSLGVKAFVLSADVKWWEGPHWLKLSDEAWPSFRKIENPPVGAREEMKAETRRCLEGATNVTTSTSKTVGWKYLISIEKFSSASRLFRVTAYVLRFIYNTRANKLKQERRLGPLSTKEILDSEVVWVEKLQKTLDQQKLNDLNSSLGPFLDSHGITRCKGRLMKSDLPYETKCHALIPPSHQTTLIIRDCHERVMPNDVKEPLAELRTRYWL